MNMKVKQYKYNNSFACFNCHKSFKREVDIRKFKKKLICPNCSGVAHNLGRYFKTPKKSDKKQWKKIKFLFDNGFSFQKIWITNSKGIVIEEVPYPKTLEEAKEFVVKYKKYAWK